MVTCDVEGMREAGRGTRNYNGEKHHGHNTLGVYTDDRLSNMQVLSNFIIAQE